MRRIFFLSSPLLAALFLLRSVGDDDATIPSLSPAYVSGEAIGCGPATAAPLAFTNRKMIPLPGWGHHAWRIATASDSAQFYFNQELSLFYGFHMPEAKASFEEAQRHDSDCALAYWGQAMAEGPYINSPQHRYNDPAIMALLEKGASLAKTEVEKSLLEALQLRYTRGNLASLQPMMQVYADRMKAIADTHPTDIELQVLYADALMLVNPRTWYDEKSREREGTAQIVALLERILTAAPNHPAALHYYIHMVEPTNTPERAKPAADRLLPLMPSVAHMVHMPSHIYIRTGEYRNGVAANVQALQGYRDYRALLKGWEGNRYTYFFHNADMQGANAVMPGDYAAARQAYGQNLSGFGATDSVLLNNPVFAGVVQFVMAQPFLLDVRFGNWDAVLQAKAPLSARAYHRLLWQFGRGMALAKTGRTEEALACLTEVNVLLNDASLQTRRPNRNRSVDAARIAALLLEGTINGVQKKWPEAVKLFEAAVAAEDNLRYSEPEDWRLHPRHYLGQSLLDQQQWQKAQAVFAQDLQDHPANWWALNGLHEALKNSGQAAEAKELKRKYRDVFAVGPKNLAGAAY